MGIHRVTGGEIGPFISKNGVELRLSYTDLPKRPVVLELGNK